MVLNNSCANGIFPLVNKGNPEASMIENADAQIKSAFAPRGEIKDGHAICHGCDQRTKIVMKGKKRKGFFAKHKASVQPQKAIGDKRSGTHGRVQGRTKIL